MADFNLNSVLDSCQKSARRGYRIAYNQYAALRNTLRDAEETIKETNIIFSSSPAYFSGATDMLSQQLTEIQSALNTLSFAFIDDLEKIHQKEKQFSITLYGRTTAGKSTLMEILTHGDGSSIGTGAARTTRDVRHYPWNGLIITDVPGIAAFGGQEDETVAFEAAKTADLILFLILSDGPQYAEAECFSRIVSLGKPVICIQNVRSAVSFDRSEKIVLRDIKRSFDVERLRTIQDQFYDYAEQFGQNWRSIPMVFTHLKAAFMSQQTDNEEFSEKLYSYSQIDCLKNAIIQTVKQKGDYFKVKTFIDAISTQMLNTMESLITQSQSNSNQGRTIIQKRKQLEDWKRAYERDANNRIRSTVEMLRGELTSEIAVFAENHYSDKKADKAWEQFLRSREVEARCQDIISSLDEQCNDELKEISREIVNELGYISKLTATRSLQMQTIVNGRKIWGWGTVIADAGLTIGGIIATALGATTIAAALGIGAIVVGIAGGFGAGFFKSRDTKELEARISLEKKLKQNVKENFDKIEEQMRRHLSEIIKKIDVLLKEIDRINSVIFKLADTQRELAWALDNHILELNKQIVDEALRLIGAEGLEYHIKAVSRVPGSMISFMLYDGVRFPDEEYRKLCSLMGERIGIVYEGNSNWQTIARVLGKGFDRSRIRIEEKIGVAHIAGAGLSQLELTKLRLAQQFTKLAIQIDEV